MRIAYAGAPGAFAHEACCLFAPDHGPVAADSFAAVADLVESGTVQAGMLPLFNSRAGEVEEVVSLLRSRPLRVQVEHDLPVRMHLLALPGANLPDIRTVTSHLVALRQCGETLATLDVAIEEAANTATAARDLADPFCAVLASEIASDVYGLIILRRDVHDDPNNITRFALVVRV